MFGGSVWRRCLEEASDFRSAGKYSFVEFVKNGACLQVVPLFASVSVIYVWAEMLKGGEQ